MRTPADSSSLAGRGTTKHRTSLAQARLHPGRRITPSGSVSLGAVIVLALAVVGIFGPRVTPYDPFEQDFNQLQVQPGRSHLLGTDDLGRDILSRLMHGARISLSISILSTAAAVLIGAPVGWVTGYLGGWHDVIVMRLVDSLMAFPGVLLAMLLIATVGPGFVTIIVALGLTYSPLFVRTIRAATLVEREKEYVAAAVASGAHVLRILKCHILPNTRQILLVQGTLTLGLTVLSEATLSYLGLGPSPETPSWGRMVFEGQRILEISPHITLFPLSAIAGAVLGFNLLGSGLADVLDPRIRFGN